MRGGEGRADGRERYGVVRLGACGGRVGEGLATAGGRWLVGKREHAEVG